MLSRISIAATAAAIQIWIFVSARHAEASLFATVRLGASSPEFPCSARSAFSFQPVGSKATVSQKGGSCSVEPDLPGMYTVSTGGNPAQEVTIMGMNISDVLPHVISSSTFPAGSSLVDSDALHDYWGLQQPPSYQCNVAVGASGGLEWQSVSQYDRAHHGRHSEDPQAQSQLRGAQVATSGAPATTQCSSLRSTRPPGSQQMSFFKGPVLIKLSGLELVDASSNISVHIVPDRPSRAAGDDEGPPCGLTVEVASVTSAQDKLQVRLLARQFVDEQARVLWQSSVPAGSMIQSPRGRATAAVSGALNIQLRADAKNASLQVTSQTSSGASSAYSYSSDQIPHGLAWQTLGMTSAARPDLPQIVLGRMEGGYDGGSAVLLGASTASPSTNVRVGSSGEQDAALARLGSISIGWDMPANYLPGVLAPYTDVEQAEPRVDMGSYHDEKTTAPVPASRGMLDATLPPFEADPSGKSDSTLAIQAAIQFAMQNAMALWLPAGNYTVTRSLIAFEYPRYTAGGVAAFNGTDNYCWSRYNALHMRGPSGAPRLSAHGRARIVVPPNTPFFSSSSQEPRTESPRSSNGPVPSAGAAVINFNTINALGYYQTNIGMNQVLQSVDIVVGQGNDKAAGVFLQAAQGSGAEDVGVDLGPDGLVGLLGGAGSGGAHHGITVKGGKIGFDLREAQPAPTLSGAIAVGYQCASLLYLGKGALSVVGFNFTMAPDAAGAQAVGSALSYFDANAGDKVRRGPLGTTDMSECEAAAYVSGITGHVAGHGELRTDEIAESTEDIQAGGLGLGRTSAYYTGLIALVDGVIETPAGAACVSTGRPITMENVWTAGCETIAEGSAADLPVKEQAWAVRRNQSRANAQHEGSEAAKWVVLNRVTASVDTPPTQGYTYPSPVYSNGYRTVPTPGSIPQESNTHEAPAGSSPPSDIITRHTWSTDWPSVESQGVIFAEDRGAKGDGYTDDHGVLQGLLDGPGNPVVALTRGRYIVSKPLVTPPGAALVGLTRHLTVISPPARGMSAPAGQVQPTVVLGATPGSTVRAPGGTSTVAPQRDAPSVLSHLTVETPLHLTNVTGITAVGPFESRQSYTHRKNVCGSDWSAPCQRLWNETLRATSPQVVFSGGAAQGRWWTFFLEDYILEALNVGPASKVQPTAGHGGPVEATYRHVLIENANEGSLRFYQFNTEHARSDANAEIRNSSNVTMYSLKTEGNACVLWIRNSTDITMFGSGGNAVALPLSANYSQGYTQGIPPSLYRVDEGSSRVRLVVPTDQGRTKGGSPSEFPGEGFDPRTWSMVTWSGNLSSPADGTHWHAGSGGAVSGYGNQGQMHHGGDVMGSTGGGWHFSKPLDRPGLWKWD